MRVPVAVLSKAFSPEPQFTHEWGQLFTMQHYREESVHTQELGFAVGSSEPGSGPQSQPLVVEGVLVLPLGFFRCGKSGRSNCAPGRF